MKPFWFILTLASFTVLFNGLLCLHLLLYPGVSVDRFMMLYPAISSLFSVASCLVIAGCALWGDVLFAQRRVRKVLLAPWALWVFFGCFQAFLIDMLYFDYAARNHISVSQAVASWPVLMAAFLLLNDLALPAVNRVIRRDEARSSGIA